MVGKENFDLWTHIVENLKIDPHHDPLPAVQRIAEPQGFVDLDAGDGVSKEPSTNFPSKSSQA